MERNSRLLEQLRQVRHAEPVPRSRPQVRAHWGAGVALAALLVGVGGMVLATRQSAPAVAAVIALDGEAEASAVVADTPPTAPLEAGGVFEASGHIVARRVATVSAQITGRVSEVYIEEGQQIEVGELMARLDATDAEAALALSGSHLQTSRAQVARVQAQLVEAEADARRQQTLDERGISSRADYDASIARRDALRAELEAVRSAVAVAQDQLRIAQIGVDNTEVRAPFTGIVVAKAAQPGEIVSPLSAGGSYTRTGIGTVVDMESLELQVDVAESRIQRIRPGMSALVILNAYPSWSVPARVTAIVPTADRARATLRVRIALLERDARIVPEMGARVRFLPDDDGGK